VINSKNEQFECFDFSKVHASRQDILHAEKTNIENELVFSLEQLDTNDNNGMKHDQADKLDCLMYVLFEYISIQNGKNALKKKISSTNIFVSQGLNKQNYYSKIY